MFWERNQSAAQQSHPHTIGRPESEVMTKEKLPAASRPDLFELGRSLSLWRFWMALAWHDWRRRYRRSLLGAAWIFVSFGLFIAVKILIFGALSSQPQAFFAVWLSTGFLVWTFIQSSIVEGCNTFISVGRWIKGTSLPYLIYVFQSVTRGLIQFAISTLAVVILLMVYPPVGFWSVLTTFASIPVLLINSIWVQLLLGVLCAQHRDIVHLAQTLIRLLFFLTPILWVPSAFGRFGVYAMYNPMTHYIAIFREPLVSGTIPVTSWIVVGVCTLAGVIASIWLFAVNRRRLVFWL